MSSLYVDRKNVELRADGEALTFYESGERVGTVPLHPLSRVFLRGDVKLSSSLLGKLGEHGIGVIVLSGRKAEPSLLLGRPHNDAARRVAQYRSSLEPGFCLVFSRAVVEAKLNGQLALIRERLAEQPMFRYPLIQCEKALVAAIGKVDAQADIASLRGLEGSAAARYFETLAAILPSSLHFRGRNRRPPRDPVNAALSLAYTLLLSEATLVIHGVGLDPYIGFYHALDFGRASLSCDVMEALRPEVDRFVLGLFRREELKAEDFSATESGCFLGKAGRGRFYGAYEKEAERLRKMLTQTVQDIVRTVVGEAP